MLSVDMCRQADLGLMLCSYSFVGLETEFWIDAVVVVCLVLRLD